MMEKMVSDRIREIRAKLELTQAAMADEFSIPKRTIEEWERGSRKPPEYVVLLLERIAGISGK